MAALLLAAGCGGADDRSPGAGIVLADGTTIHTVERTAADATAANASVTVLFLHGASFTADVWVDTGLLDQVAAAGFRAVAIDMPGYGRSSQTGQGPAEFLANYIATLDASAVVLVSPSASGGLSLPLVIERPELLAGFVPIAPVGIDVFLSAVTTPIELTTLVVWGEDDTLIDSGQAGPLAAAFSPGEVAVLSGAGHAAYQDRPGEFGELLIDFADRLTAA